MKRGDREGPEGELLGRSFARLLDSRRPATVLHTSDCHLGTSARRDEEAAFERAIACARDEGVDAVVIAGDLFDHVRVSDETLRWTAERFGTLVCPVVVIRGNHDVFDGRSVHERLVAITGLGHVHVIDDHDGRIVEIPGTDLVIWGRAMLEHEPGYRPFAGLPEPPPGRWTIATGHGLVLEDDSSGRSSPISASDLAAVTWDYVALGHVHAYLEVRDQPTPVRYPGATATSRDGTPGVVLVDFIPGTGARPRWVGLG
jgi:DNA repair exonuclease SbcCD nuclease subunit